jgi:DNA polymerase III delta subunit
VTSPYRKYVQEINGLFAISDPSKLPKFIVFGGASSYLIAKSSKSWLEHCVANFSVDLAFHDMQENPPQSGSIELGQSSMFHSMTMNVFNDVKDQKTLAQIEKLAKSAHGTQIFCATMAKKERPSTPKISLGIYIDCNEPENAERQTYLTSLASSYGVKLHDSAWKTLADFCASDLWQIERELQKISLLSDGVSQKVVTSAELAECIGTVTNENAFALSDAILASKMGHTHKIVGDLLENRESSIAILGVLSRHERNACALSGNGSAGHVKLPSFVAKKFQTRYKGKKPAAFKHAFKAMSRADIELKSTSTDDTLLLSELLENIEPTI